jgi:hypothetical protein
MKRLRKSTVQALCRLLSKDGTLMGPKKFQPRTSKTSAIEIEIEIVLQQYRQSIPTAV